MGVKSGGCSGLSYTMDLIDASDVGPRDTVEAYEDEGFKYVVDPKALLYLFGMQLDYCDDLIGGGFRFDNPNADKSCGCGMSFGVPTQLTAMAKEKDGVQSQPGSCTTTKN